MRESSRGTWRDFLPLIAVFAVGLLLAASAFMAVRSYYQSAQRQQFGRSATYYGTRFKDDVARHVNSLAAIRAFVSSSRSVTRWEFSSFAHQILPQNPGFRAVLWAPAISAAARLSYERSLQDDGLYGLHIGELNQEGSVVTAGDRTSYLPISFVEPFDGNIGLVGLDLAPIPRYGEIFAVATKSGHVAASAPLTHTLALGAHGPAVLLAFPLKQNSAADASPEGFVLGVLQLQGIIDEAIGPAPVQATIAWQDETHVRPVAFAGADTAPAWFHNAPFYQKVPFEIADRHYLLLLRADGHDDAMTGLYVPAGAALLVLALTALLAQSMTAIILRNRLVERAVIARTAQLRAANESLQSEVEQRRQAETELRIARDKAESGSRAKSAFLATMSHELRTPLNAIIGFSSILAEAVSNARHGDHAHEILRSGRRLLDLINDILDLTQMDGAAGKGSDALVYLDDLIADGVIAALPAAKEAGVVLKASIADHLPALYGDAKRITRALAHLISNAIKFTPRGGAAVVTARMRSDGALAVDVADTGVGMPEEVRDKIREVFSQYDGRLARRYEGTGLGLTYVGKVGELHEASLDIISEVGKGTRISLVFHSSRVVRNLEVA